MSNQLWSILILDYLIHKSLPIDDFYQRFLRDLSKFGILCITKLVTKKANNDLKSGSKWLKVILNDMSLCFIQVVVNKVNIV